MKFLIIFVTLSVVCFGRMVVPYGTFQAQALKDNISWDDFNMFMEGFVEGVNVYKNFTNIQECSKGVPKLVNDTLAIIDCIKSGDVVNLTTCITRFFLDAMQYGQPCGKAIVDIEAMIALILQMGFEKLLQRFKNSMWEIIVGLANCGMHFAKLKYKAAGSDLGGIVFILIFQEII